MQPQWANALLAVRDLFTVCADALHTQSQAFAASVLQRTQRPRYHWAHDDVNGIIRIVAVVCAYMCMREHVLIRIDQHRW